ncbi:MAG: hypothetical protein ACRDRV_14685 [Pseudonocardiaceae bacterium]
MALTSNLPPARSLDVACGSGFLTRHLLADEIDGRVILDGIWFVGAQRD